MATPTPFRPLLGPSRILLGSLRASRRASSSSAPLAAAAARCIGRHHRHAAASRSFSSLPPSRPNDPDIERIIQQAEAAAAKTPPPPSTSPNTPNSSPTERPEEAAIPEPGPEPQPKTSTRKTPPEDGDFKPTDGRPSPFSHFMDNLQTRFLAGTQTLNELTGYDSIEGIKRRNAQLEAQLSEAQTTLRDARARYKTAHSARASTQREVTTLLARKDSWAPPDLERFTHLYRHDHALEAEAARAAEALTEAEADEAALSQRLNSGIMRRYHEEQIWSDRIRRASTWGTWGLMGVNVLLFLAFQFVAEPWRRRRLVTSIAEGEKGVLDEVRRELEAVRSSLASFEKAGNAARGGGAAAAAAAAAAPIAATPPPPPPPPADDVAVPSPPPLKPMSPPPQRSSWSELASDPKLWRPAVTDLCSDLCSERRVQLRMRDVSVIALESALAGAIVVVTATSLVFRR
ncbi:hypothetical protein GGTG_09115 [Gaeumannomyces tritici R3-111a-1]|uniref:Sensitive to high expression protein 9, mitochondrial n=1 Tax=Gaeumannomyces tritici (strain R3-111a-1) TaxID=644352 RepID=J3P6H5_GAET3|nr:hypothetical protein GGTG_09115 [Gaeumannomyces tritici R3-111a-1]EJT72249.1 hypothetical protein GGTG_09115 [Gaeumannomyces tritici R3-111a-1]